MYFLCEDSLAFNHTIFKLSVFCAKEKTFASLTGTCIQKDQYGDAETWNDKSICYTNSLVNFTTDKSKNDIPSAYTAKHRFVFLLLLHLCAAPLGEENVTDDPVSLLRQLPSYENNNDIMFLQSICRPSSHGEMLTSGKKSEHT